MTIGATETTRGPRPAPAGGREWRTVAAAAVAARVPVVVKGVTSADMAWQAIDNGARAVVFSDYGARARGGATATVLTLPAVLDAVDGRIPVLVDGGFRRGTDILKALAIGAAAVVVARPAVWGLAAYGAAGVQGVLEMLQTELARYMAMCGRSSVQALDRDLVRVHAR